jgi:Enoyl-(Acyl carrier protein) reductase
MAAVPDSDVVIDQGVHDEKRFTPGLVTVHIEHRLPQQVIHGQLPRATGGRADHLGELRARPLESAVVVVRLLGVAAKFGLRGVTKSAAVELACYNIRVNSIHPGLVHTPLSQGVTEEFMAPIPMRRGASPAEISTFVVFLVSDESSYATGSEFVIDGGLTGYVPVKI